MIRKLFPDFSNKTVDVVVPIFRGYGQTRDCISSVLTSIDNFKCHLFLVNDHTPDINIQNFLKSFKENSSVTVINNSSNLGFVKSANIGMKQTNNDVIVLNSDTLVTDHWIDNLHDAACFKENIGTVTALTNKGAIVSVPEFNRNSETPKNLSLKNFAHLVIDASKSLPPVAKIPSCVGHCVYIKRSVLNEVGYFDEKNFGKGYGEEVDFSQRIKRVGWCNVASLRTFVYHVGSVSFGGEKNDLIRKHKRIINKKYFLNRIVTRLFILSPNDIKKLCKQIQRDLREAS